MRKICDNLDWIQLAVKDLPLGNADLLVGKGDFCAVCLQEISTNFI
jgi:hypothetical protein